MKKILLDTNAYSAFLRGDNHALEAIAKAETVYMSVVVIAELLTGFKAGSKEKQNKKWLQEFLDKSTVQTLDISMETAEIFSEIKHRLSVSDTPLPINDIWIAAHAVETGSVLVTYDAHFSSIVGLRIWSDAKKETKLDKVQ